MKSLKQGACSILFVSGLVLSGCSTSEFGSGKQSVTGSHKDKGTEDAVAPSVDENNSTDPSNEADQDNSKGAEEFANRTDSGANGHDADTEISEGCKLPDNVKSMISTTSGQVSILNPKGFGLLGWGSSGGGATKMDLTNVDIHDCSWFDKVKDDPNVKFAYVYQKRGLGLAQAVQQSYVEPVLDSADQRVCMAKASQITVSMGKGDGATMQCALIPRDKNGAIIEN